MLTNITTGFGWSLQYSVFMWTVYIGPMKHIMNMWNADHKWACWLVQSEKLPLVEHLLASNDHVMWFENTKILSSALHYELRYSSIIIASVEKRRHSLLSTSSVLSRTGEAWGWTRPCTQHCAVIILHSLVLH